jgi:hypothetical protein
MITPEAEIPPNAEDALDRIATALETIAAWCDVNLDICETLEAIAEQIKGIRQDEPE